MTGSRPLRVLVTRPEPGASTTARRLEACGFEPLLLPLSRIVALPFDGALPADVAAVAITSANALRHLPRRLVDALAGLDCFCVGDATAAAARAAGFTRVHAGGGDAAALAAEIAASGPPRRLLYLAGRLRRPDFERALAAAGVEVAAIEVYDTVPLRHDGVALAARLGGRPVDAALLYSAAAATALDELTAGPGLAECFERTRFLCISDRVAGVLGRTGRRETLAAPEPTEAALLSLLCRASRVQP